jgi:hypothetical protein
MTGLPKNLFNKIKQMIFQYTSTQRSDIAALQTAVGTYKEYTATVTQTGTSAPVATVLNNTLGGTLVWTRSATGTYLATLTGAFPTASKVVILTSFTSSNLAPAGSIALTSAVRDTANRLKFITATMDNAGARTVADSALSISLLVRVYP